MIINVLFYYFNNNFNYQINKIKHFEALFAVWGMLGRVCRSGSLFSSRTQESIGLFTNQVWKITFFKKIGKN